MLLPIRHENMTARRWPVVTLTLIVLNTVAFLLTHSTIERQAAQLGPVKAHILMLAASHPELKMPEDAQQLVTTFREHNPGLWKELEHPNRELADGFDVRMRLMEDAEPLQAEMNSLAKQYTDLAGTALTEKYAFVPAHPTRMSYITANFLHGGWLHLIGNMWFLWLAGFVLEDAWGRVLYSVVYVVAGVAALQVHAWVNAGSLIPALGASGAVAALMGAFLVRFPKMRIEMMWLWMWMFRIRVHRFQAPAYALLPVWLLMEVFYGSLFGKTGGVAHWAHVGGFVFGAMAAGALHFTGLEHVANKAIEEQVTLNADPEIAQASELMDRGQFDEALTVLTNHMASQPDSIDACNLLQQAYWRKNDIPAYHEAITKLCTLHLKQRYNEAAWQDYEEFLSSGGKQMPAATWLELCRAAEAQQSFERALDEYEKLAAAYPAERPAMMAQLGAGRICLARLNRPQDALHHFQAAAASPVPHLDLETDIEAGIRAAKAASSPAASAAAATAPA
jgi:membrane associated rhomboid family serine protease